EGLPGTALMPRWLKTLFHLIHLTDKYIDRTSYPHMPPCRKPTSSYLPEYPDRSLSHDLGVRRTMPVVRLTVVDNVHRTRFYRYPPLLPISTRPTLHCLL